MMERVSGVRVCDGTTAEDLDQAAEGAPPVAAGTGGFAAPWIQSLGIARRAAAESPKLGARWLVINGSRHPASREQVARACQRGMPVISLGAPEGDAPGQWTVLTTPDETIGNVADLVADAVRTLRKSYDGLVIFGGDTVLAALRALGATTLLPAGDLLPGIPLSSICAPGGLLPVVTKAGGFGARETILFLQQAIEQKGQK
jgi:4-hydroxythreonine-4-phosphate dehydrogenase